MLSLMTYRQVSLPNGGFIPFAYPFMFAVGVPVVDVPVVDVPVVDVPVVGMLCKASWIKSFFVCKFVPQQFCVISTDLMDFCRCFCLVVLLVLPRQVFRPIQILVITLPFPVHFHKQCANKPNHGIAVKLRIKCVCTVATYSLETAS